MRRSRYVLIGLAVVLMATVVVVVGHGLTAGQQPARVPPVEASATPVLPSEAGMYRRAANAVDYAAMPRQPNRRRTLAVFYARRAYPGAPPIIPHAVDDGAVSEALGEAAHVDDRRTRGVAHFVAISASVTSTGKPGRRTSAGFAGRASTRNTSFARFSRL